MLSLHACTSDASGIAAPAATPGETAAVFEVRRAASVADAKIWTLISFLAPGCCRITVGPSL